MSYYKDLLTLTDQIHRTAKKIGEHQKYSALYADPKNTGEIIWLGADQHHAFRKDGTPNPIVDDIRLAYIKSHERRVIELKSELEGLRWKMAQLMKEAA